MPQTTHAQTLTPTTPSIQISVINESTVLADTDVAPVVAALQKQVSNDFRPIWGTDATLTIVPKGTQPAGGSWWLVLLDDSDQANALGYHDLTAHRKSLCRERSESGDVLDRHCQPRTAGDARRS